MASILIYLLIITFPLIGYAEDKGKPQPRRYAKPGEGVLVSQTPPPSLEKKNQKVETTDPLTSSTQSDTEKEKKG